MAKTKKPASGHISFRLPLELHEQLLEIASHLGIDLSGLLNLMIQEVVPGYLDKARKIAEKGAKARQALNEISLHTEHPLVRRLVVAGRAKNRMRRREEVIDLAINERKPEDPPLKKVVQYALSLLAQEEADRELEEEIDIRYRYLLNRKTKEQESAADEQ